MAAPSPPGSKVLVSDYRNRSTSLTNIRCEIGFTYEPDAKLRSLATTFILHFAKAAFVF